MKNFFCLFLPLMMALGGCSSEEENNQVPSLIIPDDVKTLNYDAKAQTVNVGIETNCSDWVIQSDSKDWCTVERISSNIQMFRLSVKENDELNVREAILTLKAPGVAEQTITVKQLGVAPAILLNPDNLNEMASTAKDVDLKITTNISKNEIEIVIPEADKEWIGIEEATAETRAMVTYDYVVHIGNNPLTEPRSSAVVLKAKGKEEPKATLNIQQKKRSTDAGDVVVEGDIKVKPIGGKDNQHHSGSGIDNTFDGKLAGEPYHSPWSTDNPTTVFPVTLEYDFDGKEDIDYIVYYPNDNGNGNIGKFKLYTANETNTEYQLDGEYDLGESGSTGKITLNKPLVKATRIKLEITNGSNGFVACKEMEFYRKNTDKTLNRQLLAVFKDITCCELREDVTDADINALPGFFANLALQMKKGTLDEWEQSFRIRDYAAYSDVEEWADRLMTKQYSDLDNVTGIYGNKGDEIILLVGDTYGHSISVQCIYENWNSSENGGYQVAPHGDMYFLETGVNKIKLTHDGMLFIMYTANPSDPASKPIRVHIPTGGGKVTGFFDLKEHKTDDKYAELLKKATYKYFCVRGEKIMFYFHREKMLQFVPNNILSAINLWDNIVGWQQELMGIDDVRPSQVNNHMFAFSPEVGYMWASGYQVAFVYTYLGNILLYDNVMAAEDNAWGPAHEIGHVHQEAINWPGSTESSNNLFSNYIIYKLGKYKSRGYGLCRLAQSRFAESTDGVNHRPWVTMGSATHQNEDTEIHMRMNWQLWTYYHRCDFKKDFWQTLFKLMRESGNRISEKDPGRRQILFAKMASKAANENLTDFFEQWGFFEPVNMEMNQYGDFHYEVTDAMITEAKEFMSRFPKPKHAFQYIEDRKNSDFTDANDYRSRESGDVGYFEQFKENMKITKTPSYTLSGKSVQVTDGEQAVAFEWRKDGKIIFFANTFKFDVPSNVSLDGAKLYAVQADGERKEMQAK